MHCTLMESDGTRKRECLRKTWWDGVKEGIKKFQEAQVWNERRRKFEGQ